MGRQRPGSPEARRITDRTGPATGNTVADRCAQVKAGYVRLFLELERSANQPEQIIERALPVAEAADDRAALDVAVSR